MREPMRKLEYEILIDTGNHVGAHLWCKEHFGPRWNPINARQGAWAMFWAGVNMNRYYRFVFAEEKDAALFALRWL